MASRLDSHDTHEGHRHNQDTWYWRLATVPRLLYIWRLSKWLGRKQVDLEVSHAHWFHHYCSLHVANTLSAVSALMNPSS